MALKFTVHGVQSFIKGHRKSGVISIHIQWNNVRFLPVTATCVYHEYMIVVIACIHMHIHVHMEMFLFDTAAHVHS